MRRELLYAAPIAGMVAIPILRKRIAPGVEAVVYAAEKTVNPGDSCSFTVVFKNEGEQSTTVNWQPSIYAEGVGKTNIGEWESFTIDAGAEVSKSRSFNMPDVYAGYNVDLIIDYRYWKGSKQFSETVKYTVKYGRYAWYVRGVAQVVIKGITID